MADGAERKDAMFFSLRRWIKRKLFTKVGLALVLILGLGQQAHADFVVPVPAQEAMLAQSLFVDLTAESIDLLSGTSSGLSLAYSGTTTTITSQDIQWSGTFTNPTTGLSEGAMSGSITPDPTFKIESGSINIGRTPYTLSGMFSTDNTNGTATLNFNLSNRFSGNLTWKDGGDLKFTGDNNGNTVLSGTIIENSKKGMTTYTTTITITPVNPLLPGEDTFTSVLMPKGGGKKRMDKGKDSWTSKTSFDGDMEMDTEAVPEPSGFLLGTVGILCIAGNSLRWMRIRCRAA
jgi:hypothetical protein